MLISELEEAFNDHVRLKFKIVDPEGFKQSIKETIVMLEIKRHDDRYTKLIIDIPWGGITFYLSNEELNAGVVPLMDDQDNTVIISHC
jgi:hypothetical protein